MREGDRSRHRVPVTRLIDDAFGLQGSMRLESLQDLLDEQPQVTQILLRVDRSRIADIERRLTDRPRVATVARQDAIARQFREQTGETMIAMTVILTLFAATIAIGVVYNNARVALSMRSRDLASLRVLGFTRGEISTILLGELAIQLALAIPVGLFLGWWWSGLIAATIDPETYRLPVVIFDSTYAFAALVAIVSWLASAALIRRKLDRLDLIGVLKTRE